MLASQLPRDTNGCVIGRWYLQHKSKDFAHGFGRVTFEGGRTTEPVEQRELEQLLAAFGPDLEAVPADDETALDAVQWDEPAAGTDAVEPSTRPQTPTSPAELLALDEDALRALAAELGATDRRWKAQRLRRFIADELGLDMEEAGGD